LSWDDRDSLLALKNHALSERVEGNLAKRIKKSVTFSRSGKNKAIPQAGWGFSGFGRAKKMNIKHSHRIGRTYPGPPPEVEGLDQN
jgi:hypothetical protein